jgi:tetratricopeptide (TPR) repeat protein
MPHVVVVPFGVPEDAEGLGLGLAALVHGFVRIGGDHIGLAQLLSKDATKAVEAFVPQAAWKELSANGPDPGPLDMVLTGSFESPETGRGSLSLLAFDPKTGEVRAKEEGGFGQDDAGSVVAQLLRVFCSKFDADLGHAEQIDELDWASLESVLRAERCIVPNPLRGGARDRFAALGHLERALSESPQARFPASRLAACAMEAAFSAPSPMLAQAAIRSVGRALMDAPLQVELLEAASAMELRFGNSIEAEARVLSALNVAPERGSLWALLCEARRSRSDKDGAKDAVRKGLARGIADPLLFTEDGILRLDDGDRIGAAARFREVLTRWPFFPSAWKNLAQIALREEDTLTAQSLVDAALAVRGPLHPDVLRQAVELSLRAEPPGVARSSRVLALSRALVAVAPQDPFACLVLSRALVETGDKDGAVQALSRVEDLAKGSPLAAEAQRGRFQLEEKASSEEVDAILRAAYNASESELSTLAARARRLSEQGSAWISAFALGVVYRRLAEWPRAEEALELALERAPGCPPVHIELVTVYIGMGNGARALEHAEKAMKLAGENAKTLAVMAAALLSCGKKDDAQATIDRAIALEPQNAENQALSEKIRTVPPPAPVRPSFLSWLTRRK